MARMTSATGVDTPACVGVDPRLFDALAVNEVQRHGGFPLNVPRVRQALAYCQRCPVTEWCGEIGKDSAGVGGGRYRTRRELRDRGQAWA